MNVTSEDYISRFSDARLNQLVADVYWRHRSALLPEDYKVGVLALGMAERLVSRHSYSGDDRTDFQALCEQLESLVNSYADKSGQYTSGSGEIGSFLIDLQAEGRKYFG